MELPEVGKVYRLIKDPAWKVTVLRIQMTPRFSYEPYVHIMQPNGNNFFGLDFFQPRFRRSTGRKL